MKPSALSNCFSLVEASSIASRIASATLRGNGASQHGRNKPCSHKSEIRGGEIPRSPPALRSDLLAGPFALLDQVPKLAPLLQLLIFARGQFGAEKKIAQRVLVQHPMHRDAFRRLFEINPVILGTIPIQPFTISLQQTEPAAIETIEVL